ncbi:hypothetical protein K2X33_11170, partial [bacterium]|nr:hypothetical protein [bacterium]
LAWPAGFQNAFNNVSCYGSRCAAAGSQSINSGGSYYYNPLIAYTDDGGASWSYPVSVNDPPLTPSTGSTGFYGVSCSAEACVAVGQQVDSPLIARAAAEGTWEYIVNNASLVPADLSASILKSVGCSDSACVAVGDYSDNLGTPSRFPYIVTSTDAGASWTYTYSSTNQPTFFQSNGYLNDVSCSGSRCVTIGDYLNTSNVTVPLFLYSTSSGTMWTQGNYTLPTGITRGWFTSVHCEGRECYASGGHMSGAVSYPLLARSIDGGKNWSNPISSTSIPSLLSPFADSIGFRSVGFSSQ